MNAPDMRSINGIQLLNLILSHGPVSRAELSKLSGLSKPTVSEQIGRLIRLGAVIETGQGESGESGGKRPTMLAFNSTEGNVAGIDIGADQIRLALTDLEGRILKKTSIPLSENKTPSRVRQQIKQALVSMCKGRDKELRAIGIGVPGRVDCQTGIVLELGNVFEWENVDLRSELEEHFGCPVRVDNDVNVALTAELHGGAGQEATTAVLIQAGTGIGSAVAIERRIHHGSHWAAGEIGHLATDSPSRQETFRGQMESILGADQIARRVRAAARRSSVIRHYLKESSPVSALFAAALERDPVAVSLTKPIESYAAFAVVNLALAYDPDTVLLSGEIFNHVLPAIEGLMSRTVPWSPKVRHARFGEEGVLTGAIKTALPAAYEQLTLQLAADATPVIAATTGH